VPSNIDLVKLHALMADIDENLQKLAANRSLSAGKKLLEQHAYRRERRKLELQVNLFHEKQLIERLERDRNPRELSPEFQQSPLGKAVAEGQRISAEKYRQMRLAGRALGAGSPGPFPRAHSSTHFGPDATAYLALTSARDQHAATSRELEDLCSSDADEANGNAKSVPSLKPGRGKKPTPGMEQARLDILAVFGSRPHASAKDVCDELTQQKKPCPYGKTWDYGLVKHSSAVNTLISRTRKTAQPLQSK
jgi:hypothetical protein